MLFRIILASFYDLLITLALLMLITTLCVIIKQSAIPADTRWYQCLLVTTMLTYFFLCLKFGGQTIGLKAWQLQLITEGRLTIMQIFLWLLLTVPAIVYGFFKIKNPCYFLFKWTGVTLRSLK
ncbi:hypothetical protein ACNVED_13735 [Legionella sp. D16C41]|uniref:hypothetical protein n=1 Tax=Legionella sp. D16C41 TaxID=3402688 RepID=UPI003AF7AE6B